MKKILKTLLCGTFALLGTIGAASCSTTGITYVEKTGTNTTDIISAAEELIAQGCDAIFTPSDNTIMAAELSIYEKFADKKIPHYAGADSFALNGAFCGYGVDYNNLGNETGKMVIDILENHKDTATYPVKTFENGIATINTEVCEKLGYNLDDVKNKFKDYCTTVSEITTNSSFEGVSTPSSVKVENADYTIGICNYVTDASLNQIASSIIATLKADTNASFNIRYENCETNSGNLDTIINNFISGENKVDLMVGIATPVAIAMQNKTDDIPVVFAAVSDPIGSKLVSSNENPGANITGTSDYLDTNAVMNLIFAQNPNAKKIGLLYDKGQDSSTTAIAAAKEYINNKNK